MSESFGKGLSVISWNVRSMSNKFDSIKERIITTRPDIVCIGETWTWQCKNSDRFRFSYTCMSTCISVHWHSCKHACKVRGGGGNMTI